MFLSIVNFSTTAEHIDMMVQFFQTVDLMYFLFIMAVFLSAYGVARLAILYPSDGASWKSLANVFFAPYWQTYGELFIEKEHLYSSE